MSLLTKNPDTHRSLLYSALLAALMATSSAVPTASADQAVQIGANALAKGGAQPRTGRELPVLQEDNIRKLLNVFVQNNQLRFAATLAGLENQRAGLSCPIDDSASDTAGIEVPQPQTLSIVVKRPAPTLRKFSQPVLITESRFTGIAEAGRSDLFPGAKVFAMDTLTAEVFGWPRSVTLQTEAGIAPYIEGECGHRKDPAFKIRTRGLGPVSTLPDVLSIDLGWEVISPGEFELRGNQLAWFGKAPDGPVRLRSPHGASGKPAHKDCARGGFGDSPDDHILEIDTDEVVGLIIEGLEVRVADSSPAVRNADQILVPVLTETSEQLGKPSQLAVDLVVTDSKRRFRVPAPANRLSIDVGGGSFHAAVGRDRSGGQDVVKIDYLGGSSITPLSIGLVNGSTQLRQSLTLVPQPFALSIDPPPFIRPDGEAALSVGIEHLINVSASKAPPADGSLAAGLHPDVNFEFELVFPQQGGRSNRALDGFKIDHSFNGATSSRMTVTSGLTPSLPPSLRKGLQGSRVAGQGGQLKVRAQVLRDGKQIGVIEKSFRLHTPALTDVHIEARSLAPTDVISSDDGPLDLFFPGGFDNGIGIFADLEFEGGVRLDDQRLSADLDRGLDWLHLSHGGEILLSRSEPDRLRVNATRSGEMLLGAQVLADELRQRVGVELKPGGNPAKQLKTNTLNLRVNRIHVQASHKPAELDDGLPGQLRRSEFLVEGPSELADWFVRWRFGQDEESESRLSKSEGHWRAIIDEDIQRLREVTLFDPAGRTRAVFTGNDSSSGIVRPSLTLVAPQDLSQDVVQPVTALIRNLPREYWNSTVCRWQVAPDSEASVQLKFRESLIDMRSPSLGRCTNELTLLRDLTAVGSITGLNVQLVHKQEVRP